MSWWFSAKSRSATGRQRLGYMAKLYFIVTGIRRRDEDSNNNGFSFIQDLEETEMTYLERLINSFLFIINFSKSPYIHF